MSYTPSFTPEYENGWEDLPLETTPITAEALNKYDDAIENIETYLSENDIVDANANIANEYDATATYSKDDYVIYSGNLYKAKQDISTAEAWDSTHWDACIVTDEMSQGGSLAELSDVDLENLADGDIIRYNGTSGKFENVAKEVYSTDEQVIGTWFGETLYRKVYSFSSNVEISMTGWTDVNTYIPNIGFETFVSCTGVDANGTSQGNILCGTNSSNHVQMQSTRNGNANISVTKIIIEYTKTS